MDLDFGLTSLLISETQFSGHHQENGVRETEDDQLT